MSASLRIVWIGFHEEGQAALAAILESGYPVEAVITLAEEALAKRSGGFRYEDLCRRHKVPLHQVRHINDPASLQLLRSLTPDLAFVIGWSQIVSPEAMATAKLGMIGAHASFLPHNRGSAPVNWAILRGEDEGGNTLIWLSESVDAGEIIDQTRFPITVYDTCATVYEKVAESNRDMILRLLPKLLAGERPGRPQVYSDEPILPRRRPQDGQIDWSKSGREVYDFIRGLTRPYPGAFSWLEGQRYLIWNAASFPVDLTQDAVQGRTLGPMVSPSAEACGQVVACGRGAIVILEVEDPDGRILKGMDLAEMKWNGKVWNNV